MKIKINKLKSEEKITIIELSIKTTKAVLKMVKKIAKNINNVNNNEIIKVKNKHVRVMLYGNLGI